MRRPATCLGSTETDALSAKDTFLAIQHGPLKPPESLYPRGFFVFCRPIRGTASHVLVGVSFGVAVDRYGGIAPGSARIGEIMATTTPTDGRWCVMVPLAIELAGARQRKPGLEVRSHGAVQHAALRVTRVVELGFGFGRRRRDGTRIGVGARMPIRLGGCAGDGNWHGSVPARTCSHGLGGAIWRCNGRWRTTLLGDALAACCPQPTKTGRKRLSTAARSAPLTQDSRGGG